MKAAIIKKWGSPNVFEISDIPKPEIEPDQVLIKVYASSVNPADCKHRIGNHRYILGSPFPIVLGYDVCGEVVETGTDVQEFKIGDLVYGDLDNKYGGALAEFALGHEKCFALKPEKISNYEAAAIPLVGLTALQALRDKGKLQKGDSVLINGAAGGVGHIAVQIAKIYGAKVIAVASKEKKDFVESLNVDEFVDYTAQDLLQINKKIDVFFDVTGNYSFLKTKHLLNPGGIYITTLPRLKVLLHKLLQPFSNKKKAKTLLRNHSSTDLKQLAVWVNENKLKVTIDKSFTLEQIAEAHAYSESGRTKGKNIVVIQ